MSIIAKVIIWIVVLGVIALIIKIFTTPIPEEKKKELRARLEDKKKAAAIKKNGVAVSSAVRKTLVSATSPLEIFIRQLQELTKNKLITQSDTPSGPKKFVPGTPSQKPSSESEMSSGPKKFVPATSSQEPSTGSEMSSGPKKFVPRDDSEPVSSDETPKPVRFVPNTEGGENKSDDTTPKPKKFIPR